MADLILIVDFDGTLYRGDAPVRYYAGQLARQLPEEAGAEYLASFERFLAEGPGAALSATDLVEAAALRESVDGWGAAANLAVRVHGLDAGAVDAAFAATRLRMADAACELEPVGELIETLAEVRGSARILLASNSPLPGLGALLDRIGAGSLFDEVVGGLGKPDGLRRLLASELGPDLLIRPWRVLSVGDHWRNDLEPAAEVGAVTGYIDRFGRADGPATVTGRTAEDVLPLVRAWAADPQTVAVRRPAARLIR
jgi:FMN phosphatase YigB (HAD superfamily)